jgi:hypothetical protein
VAQLIGNSTITSKDTSVYLNAAQLNELYKDNLTVNVPSGSQVIFQDSDANIASFNVSLLPVLGVTEVQSTDVLGTTLFTLPAASVLSLAYENIPAYYSDGATPLTVVADTNANIGNGALTPAQIDTLQSYGITTIESTDGPLDLNAAQINELFNDGMTASAPPNNNVIFSDNVANIQTFLLNAIQNGNQNELSTVGVTEVQSLDIPFTLTIQEALVLATDFVPAYDADSAVAIIADTPSNIESLQSGDVDALELDGFTTIQNTTPGLLQLNAPLVIELALDGVKIVNGSQSTLYYDSASYFNNNSMDSQVLSALVGAGITGIETTDGPVAIYVAQFQDLPFSIIAPKRSDIDNPRRCGSLSKSDVGANRLDARPRLHGAGGLRCAAADWCRRDAAARKPRYCHRGAKPFGQFHHCQRQRERDRPSQWPRRADGQPNY